MTADSGVEPFALKGLKNRLFVETAVGRMVDFVLSCAVSNSPVRVRFPLLATEVEGIGAGTSRDFGAKFSLVGDMERGG